MSEMIEHEGVVIEREGSDCRVRIVRASSCSSCAARGGCIAAEGREQIIVCECEGEIEVGDEVLVRVSERVGWIAVLWSFVVPFCLLVLMLWLLGGRMSEGWSGTLSILSVGVYYVILHLFSGYFKRKFIFVATKK